MLSKRKTLWSQMKSYAKFLWLFICFVTVIATIALLSTYVNSALDLRTTTTVTNNFIVLPRKFNTSIYEKFLQYIEPNFSKDNESSQETTTEFDDTIGFANKYFTSLEESVDNCLPEPPREDFSKCGNRVADRKCCEYIAAWKYKKDLLNRSRCIGAGFGIVGGSPAEQGEFPHMAAVGFKYKYEDRVQYQCGGSLISEQFVLTAAHCTYYKQSVLETIPSVVGLGGNDITQVMKTVKIKQIIKHEKYQSPKRYYDIALLKLYKPVVFTYTIHPACLSTDLDFKYMKVNVTGWGTTDPSDTSKMSNVLQVATVNLVNRNECKDLVQYSRHFEYLRLHQICAGNTRGGTDTCRGDSGGPAQVRINTTYGNIHRVVAITSFGFKCALSGYLSVYVSVPALITWIERHVWPVYTNDRYEGVLSN